MSFTAPRTGSADVLTRTTLQIDGSISSPSIAVVIRALQRVPGVLLAEMNAASTQAIVAHDAAVPNASLLAAAAGAGVRAEIVGLAPLPALNGNPAFALAHLRFRRFAVVATVAFLTLALVDVLVPNSVEKHWLLPMVISALWVFFFTEAMLRRRR